MVVCPTCREVNEEGRALCQKCGSSLEPSTVALLPRHGERPPIEIRKPPQPSKWRPLVMLGVIVGVGVVVGAFVLLRPDPCGGTNFESENFGYCIVVPEGWEAGPAQFGADVTLDQFAPPTGSATVVVEAVDLETGVGLNQWSEFVRQRRGVPGSRRDQRGEARRRRRAPMGCLGRRRGRGQFPDARGRHRERERRLASHAERPAGRVRHERRRVPRHARLVSTADS